MKLFYYQRPGGNFGDDLNPWLWDRLIPGILDEDERWRFVGLGTLLNHKLPPEGRFVVLGTGAGLGEVPRVDERWVIYGVRGPRTAAAMGLDPALALTDPAMALYDHFTDRPSRRRGVGFMPHHATLMDWDWREAAEALGLVFIDPCAPIHDTMRTIAGLDRLVTEAMHGAIVADALRVPWVGVRIDPYFYQPKWDDWAGSLALDLRLHRIEPLFDLGRHHDLVGRLKNVVKRGLKPLGIWRARFTPPCPPKSAARTVEMAFRQLELIAGRAEPQLSDSASLDRALDRFYVAASRFRSDWQSGRFHAA